MKDALGHGSNPLGSRIQGVLARGQSGAQRVAAHEWMGDGIARKVGSEVMYDRAMAAAKMRDDADAAHELHSGTQKSAPAQARSTMGTHEVQALRANLRAKGFATIRKD